MRKQIAAANWKMNLTYQNAEKVLSEILDEHKEMKSQQQVIFAVPFPYLIMANSEVADAKGYAIAAQNCHDKINGAYTGEVSAEMLRSINVNFCVVGHSERRELFFETNKMLAEKINTCIKFNITPIFCCGESLRIREEGNQDKFVMQQLEESIFHVTADQVKNIIIAYEPVWAIGTGKTATSEQAQEMHKHIRLTLASKYGNEISNEISILYGGSVKPSNASELFGLPDVDGGLVGGASLIAKDFIQIIKALKK